MMTDGSSSPAATTQALQEILGVTESGKCAKHPNYPVLMDDKITSCRICFSEEKLSGIQQSKSFAAVVQQLQKVHKFDASVGNLDLDSSSESEHLVEGQDLVNLLQQPMALEGVMKRLSQVQNWILRKKEKEVSSLQMQIQRLEQRLSDADMTLSEQKQTIRSLRRTIQQDLRIIKTMAVQKERDEAEIEALSSHGSFHGSADSRSSPQRRSIKSSSSPRRQQRSSVALDSVGSPQKPLSASPSPNGSPEKNSYTVPMKPAMSSRMQEASRKAQQRHNSAALYGLNAYSRSSMRSLDVGSIPEDGDDRSEVFAAPPRRQYWSDDDEQLSMSSHKIFQSFRGGLLDIPKSPPPARHDKVGERKKLRVQLDAGQMQALRMPSMRQIIRRSSADTELSGLTRFSVSPGMPVQNVLVAPGSAPSSADTMVSGVTSDGRDEKEKVAFEKSDIPALPFDDADASPMKESIGEGKDEAKGVNNDFFFNVTQAECQDKYGDTGLYTGSVIVTEGLPHGPGIMNYDSGRVYSGVWVSGQWHGKGKLLNPNGDSYEGDFVFDSRHGHGVYTWDNGDVYVGNFIQDKRHGDGKFSFHNGSVYEGEFADGMFEGFGTYKSDIGYYEGEWKQGRYEGTGELRYATGGKYTGEFKNSVAHGFGLEITPDGKKRRGVWEEGKPVENFQRN